MKLNFIHDYDIFKKTLATADHDDPIVVSSVLLNNVGIDLLTAICNTSTQKYKIVFACESSIPYCIYAIEKGVSNILIQIVDLKTINNLLVIAKHYGCRIFNNQDTILSHFRGAIN